jgi:uncharacterized protein YacL
MFARAIGLLFSLSAAGLAAWVSMWASSRYIAEYRDLAPFPHFEVTYHALFAVFGLLVGFTAASLIYRQALNLFDNMLSDLRRIPGRDKAAVVLGVFMGLGLTALLGILLIRIPKFGPQLVVLVGMVCVYMGVAIAMSMKEELYFFFPGLAARGGPGQEQAPVQQLRPKLLDTNVIIDGRIADIARAGFIEGPIYVPGFVLEELHLIADSSDTLKRNRGRRGLDILNQMQQEPQLQVEVVEPQEVLARRRGEAVGQMSGLSHPGATEGVDAKLVQLAKEVEGVIVTNDFNLNKVAQLQGIRVLNVNELANAVKPVVLPGEELTVTIVREGKEPEQGVAYLDDGTMVVVERGKERIGETVRLVVTSVLQTVAGKMIFGNLAAQPGPVGAARGSGQESEISGAGPGRGGSAAASRGRRR